MVTFQFLDWLWVALFVLIMVGAGVLFYRLGKRSESDFFLAGRGLPWWLPASSVYATHTATDTPIWVTGVIYKYGFMGIWYTFFSAWCAISAFVSTRIFRRSLAYTQAEWNTLRFGGLGAEMLRGWISGWQVFMNMFILGWVGIAMGKVCGYLFGWDEWIGLTVFSTICALYVLSAGYWGVIMADFQQGVIAFAVIIIVSIWGIIAAGGPSGIIEKLDSLNSTSYWQVPESINSQTTTKLRILNSETNKIISKNNSFVISSEIDTIAIYEESKNKINILANDKNQQRKEDSTIILFPSDNDILIPGHEYLIVWVPLLDDSRVNLEYSTDNGSTWKLISEYNHDGQSWRIDPFAFTSWFGGDFPFAWFITMLVIALIGGFGMGTSIDWYAEAQRIQSAKTVRDSSYSIWWGTALVLIRNSVWAIAILGFFALFPAIISGKEYEMGWFRLGFDFLPVGLLGFFFAAIIAIHISTISTHLNLGAMYFTRDLWLHYFRPKANEKELVWVGRLATLILLVGSFFYGLMMEDITSWLIFALWLMAAGVWLPNILQVIWWRFNAWGYLVAWIANLGLSWIVVWILPSFGVLSGLPDYIQFWLLMVAGALIYIPVTFLTKPEDKEHLIKYYVMSRPIGFWKPIREEAERRGLLKEIKEIK